MRVAQLTSEQTQELLQKEFEPFLKKVQGAIAQHNLNPGEAERLVSTLVKACTLISGLAT
jgi:hypothetical protein